MYIFTSSEVNSRSIPEQFLVERKNSKSFKNSANKTGDKFSPLSNPSKTLEKARLITIKRDIRLYPLVQVINNTKKNFPLMSFLSNFDHSPTRQTESNALLVNEGTEQFYFF